MPPFGGLAAIISRAENHTVFYQGKFRRAAGFAMAAAQIPSFSARKMLLLRSSVP